MKRVALVLTGVLGLEQTAKEPWCVGSDVKVPVLRAIGERGCVLASDLSAVPAGILELFGVAQRSAAASTLLSAIAHGVSLEGVDLLFRCDFVTTAEGRIVDRLEGKMTDQEGRLLVAALDERIGNDVIRFCAGSQQRHFLVIRDSRSIGVEADSAVEQVAVGGTASLRERRHGAKHPLAKYLAEVAARAAEILAAHEVNHVRVDLHENPANALWIWDGVRPSLVTLSAPVSFDAMVTTADYLIGLAKLLDIQAVVGHRRSDAMEALNADVATLQRLLHSSERVLMHVDVGTWAGGTGKRSRLMEQVDRILFGALQEHVDRAAIRLAVLLLGPAFKRAADRQREWCRCQAVLFDGEPSASRVTSGGVTEVLPWLCR